MPGYSLWSEYANTLVSEESGMLLYAYDDTTHLSLISVDDNSWTDFWQDGTDKGNGYLERLWSFMTNTGVAVPDHSSLFDLPFYGFYRRAPLDVYDQVTLGQYDFGGSFLNLLALADGTGSGLGSAILIVDTSVGTTGPAVSLMDEAAAAAILDADSKTQFLLSSATYGHFVDLAPKNVYLSGPASTGPAMVFKVYELDSLATLVSGAENTGMSMDVNASPQTGSTPEIFHGILFTMNNEDSSKNMAISSASAFYNNFSSNYTGTVSTAVAGNFVGAVDTGFSGTISQFILSATSLVSDVTLPLVIGYSYAGNLGSGGNPTVEYASYFARDSLWTDLAMAHFGTDKDGSIYGNDGGLLYIESNSTTGFTINDVVQVMIADGQLTPSTTNDIDLGNGTQQYKDLYIDGMAYIDGLGENLLVDTDKGIYFRTTSQGIGSAGADTLSVFAGTTLGLAANGATQVAVTDGYFLPYVDNDVDLGSSSYEFKDLYVDGKAYIDELGESVLLGSAYAVNFRDTGQYVYSNASNQLVVNATSTVGLAVGGVSQVVVTDGYFYPAVDNDVDLGSSSYEFKDLYVDGMAYIDGIGATTRVYDDQRIEFRDANQYIRSQASSYLAVAAGTGIVFGVAGAGEVLITDDSLEIYDGVLKTANGVGYDFQGYTAGAPTADGYLTFVADGVTYRVAVDRQ
jgi:hypothetical protein